MLEASNRFQSTSSARRTTGEEKLVGQSKIISIHVLREEDDLKDANLSEKGIISIHVLREEDDSKSTQKTCASFAQKVQSFPCRAV